MNMHPTEDQITALLSDILRGTATTHLTHTEPRGNSMLDQCAGEWRDATPGDDVPATDPLRLLVAPIFLLTFGITVLALPVLIAAWAGKL